MLFSRFLKIEIDASLIDKYPKNIHAKIQQLSIKADTLNFFIKLLKNMPSSVNHLSIKNMSASINSLVVDVSQKSKFNTKSIRILELDGFANNLKQIANVLNHDLFPNLTRLDIITSAIKDKKNRNIEHDLLTMVKGQNRMIVN